MKMIKLLAGALCLALFAIACNKDRDETRSSITGQWKPTFIVTTATNYRGETIKDTLDILVEGDYNEFRERDTVYVVDHGRAAVANFYKINGRSITISPDAAFCSEEKKDFSVDYIRASEMSLSVSQIVVVHGVTTNATVATIFKK